MVERRYLSEHPDLEWSKRYIIDEKYLKKGTIIHHINFDPKDNRIENLWICEDESKHQAIQRSLLNLVNELLKSELIIFKEGEYKNNFRNKK